MVNFNLSQEFYRHSMEAPDRLALWADGAEMSYGELAQCATNIAEMLSHRFHGRTNPRVGILGSRSIIASAAVLGVIWAGHTYVPFSLQAPPRRTIELLDLCNLDALIADGEGVGLLTPEVLAHCPRLLILPQASPVLAVSIDTRAEAFETLPKAAIKPPTPVAKDDLAVIIFTSGTTGVPKGVMISAGAIRHYLDVMQQRYRIRPDDRAAQTAELTFDLSISNLFLAWCGGASVHVVPRGQMMTPARFIAERAITTWLSVPSVITTSARLHALKPGSLPSLRASYFAGEPLSTASAQVWQQAAPNSAIENQYGPTETTVVCTFQPVNDQTPTTPDRAQLAIGVPLPGTEAAIFDSGLCRLPPGQPGELAISGPQLATGYLDAPEMTLARFPVVDGKRWYLTGDHAFQDKNGIYHHLGRMDHQVKVRGYRIELEEIEAHLRAVAMTEFAAAVAWPITSGVAQEIVAFVAGTTQTGPAILGRLAERLPRYMLPNAIKIVPEIPLTVNGKIDRRALMAQLASGVSNET